MNHSTSPNISTVKPSAGGEILNFAVRDICEGEEITVDYRELEEDSLDIPPHGDTGFPCPAKDL